MKIEYGRSDLRGWKVDTVENERGRKTVSAIDIDGRKLTPTPRFWTSLGARFGISQNVFKYFDHCEVFQRISERSVDTVRYAIENDGDGDGGDLLAVSAPESQIVTYDQIMELAGANGGDNITYSGGVVKSQHDPRGGAGFDIAGDRFRNKFALDTPIDGYGGPSIYLMLLRLVCSNGAIAMAPAFRQQVSLGGRTRGISTEGTVTYSITRALDQFNNEEGYAALRDRFTNATQSWASVFEAQALYKLLVANSHNDGWDIADGDRGATLRPSERSSTLNGLLRNDDSISILEAFHRLTGDINQLYGLANVDALSDKKAKQLPVNCTVYDMINFGTELSSHYATPAGARKIDGWVGGLVSNEYDLEGTKQKFGQFADFHMGHRVAVA